MDPVDPRAPQYVGPPTRLDPNYIANYNLHEPHHHGPGSAGADHMNMPIVIGLVLSAFLFLLFAGFYLSPLCLNREKPAGPLDPEDAYFTDENHKPKFPYMHFPFSFHSRAIGETKKGSKGFYSLIRDVTPPPPPPAYTSRPNSPILSRDGISYPNLPRYNSYGRSSKSRFFSMPKMLTRTTSMPAISKPIPHPEGPLPGPDVSTDSEELTQVSDTTFVRPGVTPRSVSDSMLYPPAMNLPTPSKAHVYNRDTVSAADQNSRFLSSVRLSTTPFGHLFKDDVTFASVSVGSSKIGLAF